MPGDSCPGVFSCPGVSWGSGGAGGSQEKVWAPQERSSGAFPRGRAWGCRSSPTHRGATAPLAGEAPARAPRPRRVLQASSSPPARPVPSPSSAAGSAIRIPPARPVLPAPPNRSRGAPGGRQEPRPSAAGGSSRDAPGRGDSHPARPGPPCRGGAPGPSPPSQPCSSPRPFLAGTVCWRLQARPR